MTSLVPVDVVRAAIGAVVLLCGAAALLCVAGLAQNASSTSEPELVQVQVLLFGALATAVWATGTWAVTTALPRGGAGVRMVLGIALIPWAVLAGSVVEVVGDVCARPGGRCG